MDYHQYARQLWCNLVVGSDVSPTVFKDDPVFTNFEANLIVGLLDIQASKHIYAELPNVMEDVVGKYGRNIARVAIWSKGDVTATAYQDIKIARSRVITALNKALGSQYGEEEAKRFRAEKIAYLVSDDKFKVLEEYLQRLTGQAKLVVIEDSRSNLRKVKELVDVINQTRPAAHQIDYIGIWATYSREGINARKAAEVNPDKQQQFESDRSLYHAVDSPSELADSRFESIYNGAHIMVDFDGVIGDNVKMRQMQAQATQNALLAAMMVRGGVDIDKAEENIINNLRKLHTVGGNQP